MNGITQEELAKKYEVSESFVSMVVGKIRPIGKMKVGRKEVRVWPEKEAAGAIVSVLKEQAEQQHREFATAERKYRRAAAILQENGLMDHPRWKL